MTDLVSVSYCLSRNRWNRGNICENASAWSTAQVKCCVSSRTHIVTCNVRRDVAHFRTHDVMRLAIRRIWQLGRLFLKGAIVYSGAPLQVIVFMYTVLSVSLHAYEWCFSKLTNPLPASAMQDMFPVEGLSVKLVEDRRRFERDFDFRLEVRGLL